VKPRISAPVLPEELRRARMPRGAKRRAEWRAARQAWCDGHGVRLGSLVLAELREEAGTPLSAPTVVLVGASGD
jgi:hypothetical protein